MKPFRLLLALIITAATLPVTSSLRASEEPTPLTQSMETMDRAYKSLRRALRTPDASQLNAYLKDVATIRAEITKGLALVPAKLTPLTPEAQAPEIKAYQQAMTALAASLDELETALKASNWQGADAIIKSINKQKSDGHERFKAE